MRFDKFTIKSQELIQQAQSIASRHTNQQIESVHLLAAMLDEKEGVARTMLRKLGVSPNTIVNEAAMAIDRLPKITGRTV
jgi:ATP-dependent Clp protease ATP-binding subunit ClpB